MSSKKNIVLFPEKGIPRIVTLDCTNNMNIDQQLSKLLDVQHFEKKTLHWLDDNGYNLRLCGSSNSSILNALCSYIIKDKITGMWIMYDINKNLNYDELKVIMDKSKNIPIDKYKSYNEYELI